MTSITTTLGELVPGLPDHTNTDLLTAQQIDKLSDAFEALDEANADYDGELR